MEQLTKKRKKKGFTLIELIAVIAIIGILAAVLVPRIVGYMNDAKRSKIVSQARTVVMTYERYAVTAVNPDETNITKQSLGEKMTGTLEEYGKDLEKTDKIASGVSIAKCRELADGKEGELVLDDDGIWSGSYKGEATTPTTPAE